MNTHQNNLTPLRRDLEKRLSDLRANGPKNPPRDASGRPIISQSPMSDADVQRLEGFILRTVKSRRPNPELLEALAPTREAVIAAGGYKVR